MSSPVFVVSSSLCWEKIPVDKLYFQYGNIPFLRQYSKESPYFNKNTSGITKRILGENHHVQHVLVLLNLEDIYIYENNLFWVITLL